MSRPSHPAMNNIRRLIQAAGIPRDRVLAAYERLRQPVDPSTINNYPWGHPGFPAPWHTCPIRDGEGM